jgi:hypothetical protein
MAEVTAMRNNATIHPIYGLPYTIVFPFLDADGDLVTGATTPDAEVSLNGDTFADCTNESTEIATSSGVYYLTLTAAEMTADVVSIIAKSATSGMKTTVAVLYPQKLPILLTSDNAGAYDSTTTINLGSGASAIDDFYNGCVVYIYAGTGSGQVRMITDYVGSTKLATVHVAWATNPDATSDLKVYRTLLAPYAMDTNVSLIEGTDATNQLGDATQDEVIEGTVTQRQLNRLILAVLTGKSSGGGTATLTFRDIGDTKNRLVVTVDSNGNRTAVGTRDGS